jgi:S-adenosylmethionine synthetase
MVVRLLSTGKKISKVDRSAAYITRHIAKNLKFSCGHLLSEVLVQGILCHWCGTTAINVNTLQGTAKVKLTDGQIGKIS